MLRTPSLGFPPSNLIIVDLHIFKPCIFILVLVVVCSYCGFWYFGALLRVVSVDYVPQCVVGYGGYVVVNSNSCTAA